MPRYRINLLTPDGSQEYAYLEELSELDFAQLAESNFECNWIDFWKDADFNCEAFIKFVYHDQILGLIRFALYPYPLANENPEFVDILNLESIRGKLNYLNISVPVGLWLIWYATNISIEFNCTQDSLGSVVTLISLETAIDYYENKVRMERQGSVTISPYEVGYAFRFSKEQASEFCSRIQDSYGHPSRTD